MMSALRFRIELSEEPEAAPVDHFRGWGGTNGFGCAVGFCACYGSQSVTEHNTHTIPEG